MVQVNHPRTMTAHEALSGYLKLEHHLSRFELDWLAGSCVACIDSRGHLVFGIDYKSSPLRSIADAALLAMHALTAGQDDIPDATVVMDNRGDIIGAVSVLTNHDNQSAILTHLLTEIILDPGQSWELLQLLVEEIWIQKNWDMGDIWPLNFSSPIKASSSQAGLQALLAGASQAGLLHGQPGVPPLDMGMPSKPSHWPSDLIDSDDIPPGGGLRV